MLTCVQFIIRMPSKFIDLPSIDALHRFYNCGKPKHPLITVVDLTQVQPDRPAAGVFYRTDLYVIMCKRFEGALKYGQAYYDFAEGTLMFTAPQQVISSGPELKVLEGWGLFFHPDLLSGTELGRRIREYSFFNYDANEALHISEAEKQTLFDCLEKIKKEYSQYIDKHTQQLIVDNIQLMLNYCNRFYDRQFITRARVNNDTVQRFEQMLHAYFAGDLVETGLPAVKYFASKLALSPHYLSDLLNKHTGKTTQEYIHLAFAEKAKQLLWSTQKPISEIAYELGFEHPSHFTKLFKSQTGQSPRAFRGRG